ncbi:MAG: biotin--[acetyl-CoA-carboxylase] ligase [Proteobacteria bacterium]|nr:biotin--[acetyl-CoA-carboxylase] ligase [Pseudomonadota bacterium]
MPVLSTEAENAGFKLLHVTRAESTNEAALAALKAGADRLWIVADEQSAGRGRQGRSWSSPKGNLYASLALVAPCPPDKAPLLGFVTGLSHAEAFLSLIPVLRGRLHLKWPNDCLIDGAKCTGILLEGTNLVGGGTGIAIGMGTNIAHKPEGLDRPVTALHLFDESLTPARVFERLSARFAHNLALFDEGRGFGEIRRLWLSHALPLGTRLSVKPPGGTIEGRFAGMDEAGCLLVETDSGLETVLAGDVFTLDAGLSPEAAIRTLA